jgi:hypothetical protein
MLANQHNYGANWDKPYLYVGNNPITRADPSGLDMVYTPRGNPYAAVTCRRSMEVNIVVNCYCHCRWRPGQVSESANQAFSSATELANQLFPQGQPGNLPKNRALRHCLATGFLALSENCRCAICAGNTREYYQTTCEGQSEADRDIGIANNMQGAACAGCGSWFGKRKSRQDVIDCCKRKLDNGQLDTGTGVSGPISPEE